jgi:hypothetical protein
MTAAASCDDYSAGCTEASAPVRSDAEHAGGALLAGGSHGTGVTQLQLGKRAHGFISPSGGFAGLEGLFD